MKDYIRKAIESAVRGLSLDASMLDSEPGLTFRRALGLRFGEKGAATLHWNKLSDYFALQHPESWRWPEEYLGNEAVYFFSNEADEPAVYKLAKGSELIGLLEECPGFEFYATNEDQAFLICHNGHDYLFASGAAKAWLETLEDRHKAWVTSLPKAE